MYPTLKNNAERTASVRTPSSFSSLPAKIIVTGNIAIIAPKTSCDWTDENPKLIISSEDIILHAYTLPTQSIIKNDETTVKYLCILLF